MIHIWKSSILSVLSMLMVCTPALACTAIPPPEFDRVDTVFWDDSGQLDTDLQFPGEFVGKITFVERSTVQIFFSPNKNKLKVRVLESTTHPDLVGRNLLIIPDILDWSAGLCPPSMPGKFIGPSIGAQGTVRGALGPSYENANGISLNYYSYRIPLSSDE